MLYPQKRGNREFLHQIYPALARGARWIERKRRQTSRAPSAHHGLLPAGLSAEHLGPPDFYFWDNFWGVEGLRGARLAARIVGNTADEEWFRRHSQAYWQDIEQSLKGSGTEDGLAVLPASPYRRLDSSAIGSLCAVCPLKLIQASDPRVVNTLDRLQECCSIGDGFFQQNFHSGLNCYLSAHMAQCYLAAGNPRALKIIRSLLEHATGTYTWPEALHPHTQGECMGEGHHGWAAAEWILLLRNLLLFEQGENLCLTRLFQAENLRPGSRLAVASAPSYFGPVSVDIRAGKKEIRLTLKAQFVLKRPRFIIGSLPVVPSKLFINGQVAPNASRSVVLSCNTSEVVAVL